MHNSATDHLSRTHTVTQVVIDGFVDKALTLNVGYSRNFPVLAVGSKFSIFSPTDTDYESEHRSFEVISNALEWNYNCMSQVLIVEEIPALPNVRYSSRPVTEEYINGSENQLTKDGRSFKDAEFFSYLMDELEDK